MCGKRAQLLPLGHGRTPLVARDDDRLRDSRKRILLLQSGSRREEGADARHDLKINPLLLERIHLLLNRTVDARIARMKAHDHEIFRHGFLYRLNDLGERHRGGIVNLRAFLGKVQKGGIDERTRIDDDIGLLQQLLPFDRDELGIACARADNVYLHVLPPVTRLPYGRK